MKKVAKFIRENEIEYDWRSDHFYIWPSFYEMEQLAKVIPWCETADGIIENAEISKNYVCLDLLEIFQKEEVEKHFPMED